jgi:16S rRNA (uracil1498-N3)-methyltransferase
VLRLQPGAELTLFDGCGRAFAARLDSLAPVRATLGQRVESLPKSPIEIELLQALSRGAKMDWVVQKSVELGVAAITPVMAARSVMKLDARAAAKKHAHWKSIAIAACEQCGRDRIPLVREPSALDNALGKEQSDVLKLLLDPPADSRLPAGEAPSRMRLLIGPEGGFSDAERALAIAAGYRPTRLGPRVLRTETAALAALAVVQHRWGDFAYAGPGENNP